MKIIVSHDVDHLCWGEHWLRDTYIPRYLVRQACNRLRGRLSPELWRLRQTAPFRARPLHNLDELVRFDREQAVPATYFVGVRRGLGMSYGAAAARSVVAWMRAQGCAVGVHGVAFRDAVGVRREREAFAALLPPATRFGVRNHYLRSGERTLALQAAAGYLFDSTQAAAGPPYAAHGIAEFPVSLMDTDLIREDSSQRLPELQAATEQLVGAAECAGWSHFTLIYHDVYHCARYPLHRSWYEWLIPWLRVRFVFEDFATAAQRLLAASPVTGSPCTSGW